MCGRNVRRSRGVTLGVTNSKLFTPMTLRSMDLSHRGWVSPMCQYSADPEAAPGVPTDWHLMHLGQFAAGGAALILTEASAVNAEGRISPRDAGIYNDEQGRAWHRITEFVHSTGSVQTKIGVQLAHAGRKASTYWPFSGRNGSVPATDHGWQAVGATDESFDGYAAPRAMTEGEINAVIDDFAAAADRAVLAGFDTVEIHAAHGYLLHQFLSPLVNTRTDAWGGDEESRSRLTLDVIDAVRARIPDGMPLLLRISATDWISGGLDADSSVRLARRAADHGVDLIDVSSGGAVPGAKIPVGPGYQTAFAEQIRRETDLSVGAVGLISTADQAEHLLATGQADGIFLARAALRDPHWWQRAAHDLGADLQWAPQYERAAANRGKY
ncbi:NADH:flavin oxidoreductase/NADH oxidase [Paenarthrobacter sp. PH39-S1]|uniref:NADH:flavin oxidoreductase/NADH oxidase n=1 Tax=Paenarthrobacter sp. PH39-S1 TaxID=3046204 RepID=UPI0024BB0FD6|nr:NADH:flavin oxidoreductase/NADH oxidase [Paenarthrobacter sp. PH39-S1]MDJ0357186.1 NADH:flavin oxidoreductase/NADH oxidase [Paenarthrobacter sp. PH39-S1]